jgi:hypothetical protein
MGACTVRSGAAILGRPQADLVFPRKARCVGWQTGFDRANLKCGSIIVPILATAMTATMDDKSEFEAFVKRQQQSAASTGADWSLELEDWLRSLSELYGRIEELLQDYIKSGAIAVSYREIPMNEEHIGSYTAHQMTLKIGPQEISLRPIGTLLIGTKGRVDVVGPSGRTRFLLVNKESSRPNVRRLFGEFCG